MSGLERDLALFLQEHGESWHWLLRTASDLGPSRLLGVLLVLLYWCTDYRAMCRVWFAFLAGTWLTDLLKVSLRHPRPCWIDPDIRELAGSKGFGMPSGHVVVATTTWGELYRQRRRTRNGILLCGILLSVAISRIYLGVHSLSQTLAGAVAGACLLLVVSRIEAPVLGWFSRHPLPVRLGILLGISLVLTLISTALRLGAAPLPEAWEAAMPLSLHSACQSSGALLGFLGGYQILISLGHDDNARDWRSRGRRLLFAGTLLAILWLLRDHAPLRIPSLPEWAAPAWSYLLAAAGGLFIALAVPLAFHRLRW